MKRTINFKYLIITIFLLLFLPFNVLAACNQWASQGKTICESKSFEGKQCAWDSSKKGGGRCYKSNKAATVTQTPETPEASTEDQNDEGQTSPTQNNEESKEIKCNMWADEGASVCSQKSYKGYKCAWDSNNKGGGRCYQSETLVEDAKEEIIECEQITDSSTCQASKGTGWECVWRQGVCKKATNDGSGETIIADDQNERDDIEEKLEQEKAFEYLPSLNLGKLSCDTVFKNADGSYNQFYYLFWNVLKIAKYAAIALTLGLSLMDFIKVIASGNKDELQKVATKSVKRLIIGVALFFIPSLLEYIMQIIGDFTTCNLL